MLHLHRAERADALVGALAALLADPLPDPFAAELVAVPTRGMERWLTQALSASLGASPGASDGLCANVRFPSPATLTGEAAAAAAGIDPEEDRWPAERLLWPLLEVVQECLAEPWLRTLARHLGERDDATRRARRLSTVRHLARLFEHYGLLRPAMVRGWAQGQDEHWQAELWRRLRAHVEQPSPAERLPGACARLREDPALVALPARLALFGLTRLPAAHLDVLRALAAGREVHLMLLHPSPALWERVALAGRAGSVSSRREDPTADLARNGLLASWGRDARELQLVLGGAHEDHPIAVPAPPPTLLGRLQADIRADRPPQPAPLDDSVQIHSCHGRARQVEVLRDAILHALAREGTLEPRDVIVMCPDIETFAPLIGATFGGYDVAEGDKSPEAASSPQPAGSRPIDLHVRLADRSLRRTNPLLGVVAELLELAGGRVTASQVLDLADREPVRRRFGWGDEELARVKEWVAASGVRWGLDAHRREPFKLAALAAGTWRSGLDRVLLGVSMNEDEQRLFGGVLPLDDVDSGAIDLAGRLAELVDRLASALDALGRTQDVASWTAAIGDAADALAAAPPGHGWQRPELQRLLDDVQLQAGPRTLTLAPAELRALLADRLAGRPTRANFRTGHLTICTLMPMRSVPHRVVCLLGMDDGVFPRRSARDGDDLIADEPQVGDRDARSEDRQLLLDALLAAQERLIVTYTGNDERTNTPRPPAVPIGELLDALEQSTGVVRSGLVVRHPLQPFDPRNFTVGALVGERVWSFDRVALAGASALVGPRAAPAPFLGTGLEFDGGALLELDDLLRFTSHPTRAFLRRRLGISLGDFTTEVADALPVELDALDRWGVGERLLAARLRGLDLHAARAAEIARGALPPGQLAAPLVTREVEPIVERIAAAAQAVLGDAGPAGSVEVRVTLDDGRLLSGTVPGVYGDLVLTVAYSRLGPRARLAAWVRWLALVASHPERPWRAVTIGRGRGAGAALACLDPLPEGSALAEVRALARLATLVELYDEGMRGPLPLALRSSAAYAEAARVGQDAVKAARSKWDSGFSYDGEDREAEHALVFGGAIEIESNEFHRCALALWSGLLEVERSEQR